MPIRRITVDAGAAFSTSCRRSIEFDVGFKTIWIKVFNEKRLHRVGPTSKINSSSESELSKIPIPLHCATIHLNFIKI